MKFLTAFLAFYIFKKFTLGPKGLNPIVAEGFSAVFNTGETFFSIKVGFFRVTFQGCSRACSKIVAQNRAGENAF